MLLYGGEILTCMGKMVGMVSNFGFGHTVGKIIDMRYLSVEQSQVHDDYAIEV